jgi:hypothetical protein
MVNYDLPWNPNRLTPAAAPDSTVLKEEAGALGGATAVRAPRVARFHADAVLADPRTPFPELQKIVAEVIGPLAAQTDVSLSVHVEIDAEHRAETGFDDQTVRTVSENARTLRLRDFGFEKD